MDVGGVVWGCGRDVWMWGVWCGSVDVMCGRGGCGVVLECGCDVSASDNGWTPDNFRSIITLSRAIVIFAGQNVRP